LFCPDISRKKRLKICRLKNVSELPRPAGRDLRSGEEDVFKASGIEVRALAEIRALVRLRLASLLTAPVIARISAHRARQP
jgi:hypothetical protein